MSPPLHLYHYAPAIATRRATGRAALGMLDDWLADRQFLVDENYTIADVANYAYVHVAGDAGYELDEWPSVVGWLDRVESLPGFENDLVPLPADARADRGLSISG